MFKQWRIISEEKYQYLMSLLDSTGETSSHPNPSLSIQQGGSKPDFITYMPVKLQEKASSVLKLLEQNPNFKVNADGSIVISNKKIHGSHICDLLTVALQTGYSKKLVFNGQREFALLIRNSTVPLNLLSSHFIQYMNGLDEHKWIQRKLTK